MSRAVGTEHGTQKAEDQNEIQGGLTDPSLGKRRQRNGNELDAAQKERQLTLPYHRVAVTDTEKQDFEDLKAVNENRGYDQNLVLLTIGFVLLSQTEEDGKTDENDHQ